ncbi:hypothetical protein FRC01_004924 [Tulasnella sp. 417]|nr:hypothetical protein FRC01_004924 [Tulasnella sp. 417]
MPIFSKLTTTLSAVLALSSTIVYAAPLQPSAVPGHNYKLSTHRRHLGANNVEFVSYHPPSAYKTFHDGDHSLLSRSANATHSLVSRSPAGPSGVSPEVEEAALSYLVEQTGLAKDSLKVRSGYTNDIGVTHVYMHQFFNGIPVMNGVANVSFDKNGKVVAFGSNMVKPDQISPATPALPQAMAIQSAIASLGIPYYDEVPATLSYVLLPAPSGTDPNRKWAMLTHQFQLRDLNSAKWVQAHVDATNLKHGDVVQVVDFVAHAAYNALEWSKQDPTQDGGFSLIKDPQDLKASPNGWHKDDKKSYSDTQGNNVISYTLLGSTVPLTSIQIGSQRTTKETGTGSVYQYEWKSNTEPTLGKNVDVARVNAFYIVNKYHDTLYHYGFNEKAFNFQTYNFGKGGAGNDRVKISVQDGSGTDNAWFATPADGQSGQCAMFLWDKTVPRRDGALENDIITHELTHGLTNRMTGGGMGEGWSDVLAFWSEQKSGTEDKPFTMGSWVMNKPAGIRSVPYSTDMTIDPYTYATLETKSEGVLQLLYFQSGVLDADRLALLLWQPDLVHDIGEVWATILIEVYWALVNARHVFIFAKGVSGFTPNNTNPNQTAGNVVFLRLLVDALAIQPCNPTFVDARNAIIQADKNRYAGANKCTLGKAFARRGLGENAKASNRVNNMDLPQGC